MEKINKPFDRSEHMRKLNAARTPESFAKSAEKRSIAMKKAWARKGPQARIEVNKKISASQIKRISERPPRLKRDIEEKRIQGIHDFYKKETLAVKEHKEYLGYLSCKDILECDPVRKAHIVAKRTEGAQRAWDRLTPEEKKERNKNCIMKGCEKKGTISRLLFETDVPRERNYCGVVTEQEMESMHG